MSALIEFQYFGCVAFYVAACKGGAVMLEEHENFQKMSFRNRTQILGAGSVLNLTVPLCGGRDQKALTKDIEIDYSTKWQIQHWRTLESCYNKSPFFLHYAPSLEQVLFADYSHLRHLDLATILWANKQLKIGLNISFSTQYEKFVPDEIFDARNRYIPAKRTQADFTKYQQVFGNSFETNLSILDLLFNLGPQSAAYLNKQQAC